MSLKTLAEAGLVVAASLSLVVLAMQAFALWRLRRASQDLKSIISIPDPQSTTSTTPQDAGYQVCVAMFWG
ncbi:hypothetical protein C8R47DRAFT_1094555 [Mycena vitilis]|nr:hypothetical protein C8R47DRAFT_1094555 [Mycena vitilis]